MDLTKASVSRLRVHFPGACARLCPPSTVSTVTPHPLRASCHCVVPVVLPPPRLQVDTPGGQLAVRAVKETLGFVSTDFDTDERAVNDRPADLRREYLLPDGTELPVVAERFKPPEMLLHPELVGLFGNKENLGLHYRVLQAVRGCAEAIQVRSTAALPYDSEP